MKRYLTLLLILFCSVAHADDVTVAGRKDGLWRPYRICTLNTVVQKVKSTPGLVGGYFFYNPNSTAAYVHFFDQGTGLATPGSTVPVWTIGIPALGGANLADMQMEFFNGIQVSSSNAATGTTTTAAGTTNNTIAITGNLSYR